MMYFCPRRFKSQVIQVCCLAFVLFFSILAFELRTSHLQAGHSITWAHLWPFLLWFFGDRVLLSSPGQPGLQSCYLTLSTVAGMTSVLHHIQHVFQVEKKSNERFFAHHHPPHFSLLSNQDYRREPLYLVTVVVIHIGFLWKVLCKLSSTCLIHSHLGHSIAYSRGR
jgi:hypothetical protein